MSQPTFPSYSPTVTNAITDAATRWPDNALMVTPDESVTYEALDRMSRRLACTLIEGGVVKGSHVGILFPNGVPWMVTWAAVSRIGGIAVPISTFCKGFELGRTLRHADVTHLVACPQFLNSNYLAMLEDVAPELVGTDSREPLYLRGLPQLRRIWFWGSSGAGWAHNDLSDCLGSVEPVRLAGIREGMEEDVTPADPMMLMYTSGSTAEPKGVVHSHGAMIRHAVNLAVRTGWKSTYRVWSPAPLFWIGGFHNIMCRSLVVGATVITGGPMEPGAVLRFMEKERATHIMAWPASVSSLQAEPSYADTNLGSVIGGTLYDRITPQYRPADGSLICGALGMTETCGPYSGATVDIERNGLPAEYRGALGQIFPGIEVRIADLSTGEALGDDEEGEVVVRGYSVLLGMHKVERAETFDRDGWYHTADRGYFRDGWLFFTGRQSEMIKTSGSNVAPGEVEYLLATYPGVLHAFVVGVPDERRGEQVVGLVVPTSQGSPDPGIDPRELRAWLRSHLSSFKVPSVIYIIAESDVEWLPSQKVDRRSLKSLAAKLNAAV